jgi:hypothetical protein
MKISLAGKAVLYPPESENHRCLLRESVPTGELQPRGLASV